MVIAFFVFGMFLGFSLGIATMALVGARHDRVACEDAEATADSMIIESAPGRVKSAGLARLPAAGVLRLAHRQVLKGQGA